MSATEKDRFQQIICYVLNSFLRLFYIGYRLISYKFLNEFSFLPYFKFKGNKE